MLRASPFSRVGVLPSGTGRSPSRCELVGAQFSLQLQLAGTAGDRRAAFEADLRAALLAVEPDGSFPLGPVVTELVVAVRP